MTAGPRLGQSRKPEDGVSRAVAPVRLRRLERQLVDGMREDLAELYASCLHTVPGDAHHRSDGQDFLIRLSTDMRRPECAMVIAETDVLMGCAFGFPVDRDGSWWLGFDGVLPRSVGQLTVSGSAFAFGGILIRPHPQDRRLARRVQERLLTDHRASLGATLVDRADHPTLATLRSWGWLDVGQLRRTLGATTFRALVLPFAERARASPEGLATMPGGGGTGGR